MVVSDQFHAPAALPQVPIGQEAGWAPEPSVFKHNIMHEVLLRC